MKEKKQPLTLLLASPLLPPYTTLHSSFSLSKVSKVSLSKVSQTPPLLFFFYMEVPIHNEEVNISEMNKIVKTEIKEEKWKDESMALKEASIP